MADQSVPAGRARATFIATALVLLLAACSSAPGGGTSGSSGPVETAPAAPPSASPNIGVVTPGQPSAPISVYGLAEGLWVGGGEVHVEIAGGFDGVFDLPLLSGETTAGRTTLTYEHQDPGDTTWSLGLVRLSFFPDADSIGIEAGGLRVQGPCTLALTSVAEDHLAGEIACGEDLQAGVEGDPREMTISGSFEAAR